MTGLHEMAPRALFSRMTHGNAPLVLDVRSAAEFASGHVPGARNIPFWSVWRRARELGAGPDGEIVVYCGHGPRARIAAALLRKRGFRKVVLLAGHMTGWQREGLPIADDRG